ncbi:MAG: bifunctional oligoribonuclease/PAP phosphatase NrnA [Clostridia bacterium]|nr:bifunctional oligoribonuclease/PAP phosphatase NrnA [Clostridia bacterium]
MKMMIDTPSSAAEILRAQDNILILVHGHPDGDTLGCGYSLCRALISMGKKAAVRCSDEIPKKFDYLSNGIEDLSFDPEFIVSVDVADAALLGKKNKELYGDKVDLSIDHHGSNRIFAKKTLLDDKAAAACEIMLDVIKALGVEITKDIANCIYTGLSTDTGCFRYSNVTPRTMRMGAEMIEAGADNAAINTVMFETKTKTYVALEKLCLAGMETYFDERFALITVTQEMFRLSGSDESECDAIASLPRQIEGVVIGATLREKADGTFKVSMRTHAPADAAAICAEMGGGGHMRAAGCQLDGPLENAKKILIENIKKYFEK